jgi:hypothetical protein
LTLPDSSDGRNLIVLEGLRLPLASIVFDRLLGTALAEVAVLHLAVGT